jgi:hypothetical protein
MSNGNNVLEALFVCLSLLVIVELSLFFFGWSVVFDCKHCQEISIITMAAPPPQSFPYDYLFKVLIIGDASVGKVRRESIPTKDVNARCRSFGCRCACMGVLKISYSNIAYVSPLRYNPSHFCHPTCKFLAVQYVVAFYR